MIVFSIFTFPVTDVAQYPGVHEVFHSMAPIGFGITL